MATCERDCRLSYEEISEIFERWFASPDFVGKKFCYFVPPAPGKTLGVRVLHERNAAHFTYRIDKRWRQPVLDLDHVF